MLLHRNRNRVRPFTVDSNDPNSINSQKKVISAIFIHIGHLSGPLGHIADLMNSVRC